MPVTLQKKYTGNIYLASDFHLGTKGKDESYIREKKIVDWLQSIQEEASLIILLGDIFDYWFEYRHVVPRGFTNFWAKMKELRNREIPIIFFTGNHDMWLGDYSTLEYGIPVLTEPTRFNFNGLDVLLHHGDGLGPGDYGYKFIKKVFSNRVCQFLFARLHPNFALTIMKYFSKTSRAMEGKDVFDASKERLIVYCEDELSKSYYDFFIFGHRHLIIEHTLSNGKSKYINLGDWLQHYSYGVFNNSGFNLLKYE